MQISATVPDGDAFCEVERALLNNRCKGITVYYGRIARDPRCISGEDGAEGAVAADMEGAKGMDTEGPEADGDANMDEAAIAGEATRALAC